MEEPLRKRVRNEISVESDENDGTAQSHENLDSNIYLTYDILRIVFQYLSSRDLANAAMVCRSWSEAANNEKSTRGPHCFIQCYKVPGNVLNCIKDARVKPSIGFFFIPHNAPHDIEACILDLLPDDCEAIMLYSSGIVLNNREMECNAYPNIVCAFLPQIPNVRIETVRITEDLSSFKKESEYLRLIDTIETCAPDHKTCLMLFCNCMGYDTAMLLAGKLQKSKENGIVSLWGGVVNDIYTECTKDKYKKRRQFIKYIKRQIHEETEPYCVAVLIAGPIQTWSTIVDRTCKTKEQVEARLRLFKDQVKLQKYSVGFMFSCKARGRSMYQEEKNVESSIFKLLFPKVPLVGCFGNGEFGKNTMSVDEMNEKKSEPVKKSKGRRIKTCKTSWYNEFSTMFMILTYG